MTVFNKANRKAREFLQRLGNWDAISSSLGRWWWKLEYPHFICHRECGSMRYQCRRGASGISCWLPWLACPVLFPRVVSAKTSLWSQRLMRKQRSTFNDCGFKEAPIILSNSFSSDPSALCGFMTVKSTPRYRDSSEGVSWRMNDLFTSELDRGSVRTLCRLFLVSSTIDTITHFAVSSASPCRRRLSQPLLGELHVFTGWRD